MTGTFLTSDQLVKLTGYKRATDQLRWLREHGVPHGIRADGRPVLTLRMFEDALLRGTRKGPNLSAAGL